jgi:hypothetical protein
MSPTGDASIPARGALPFDIDRLTDHVVSEIDRRFIAHNERFGRI